MSENIKSQTKYLNTNEQRIYYDDGEGLAATLMSSGFQLKGTGLDRGKVYFIFEDSENIRNVMDYWIFDTPIPCRSYYSNILHLEALEERTRIDYQKDKSMAEA